LSNYNQTLSSFSQFLPGGVEEVGDLMEAKGEADDLVAVRGEVEDLGGGCCILSGRVGGDRGRNAAEEPGEHGCLPYINI
jgi:hypothetical protein